MTKQSLTDSTTIESTPLAKNSSAFCRKPERCTSPFHCQACQAKSKRTVVRRATGSGSGTHQGRAPRSTWGCGLRARPRAQPSCRRRAPGPTRPAAARSSHRHNDRPYITSRAPTMQGRLVRRLPRACRPRAPGKWWSAGACRPPGRSSCKPSCHSAAKSRQSTA